MFKNLVFNALSGVALTGAYAPLSWFPLAMLVPVATLMLWRRTSNRQAVLGGFIFGFAHFGTSFYWVYYSLHDFGEAPIALAIVLTVLFAATLAIYFVGLAWTTAFVAQRVKEVPLCLLLYPSLWVLGEWLRGVLFTGFPWNFVGQAMVDAPLVGVLPLFGVLGASWLTILLSGCVVLFFSKSTARFMTVAIFTSVIIVASAMSLFEWTASSSGQVKVALVQANITQDLKFNREKFQRVVNSYHRLTEHAIGADLVLWPETALPAYYDLLEEMDVLSHINDKIQNAGGEFVLGAFVRNPNGDAYNAVVKVAHPLQLYRKRHLVPFGEYFPLRKLMQIVSSWVLIPMSDLKAGNARPLMRIGQHDVGISICYEVSFGNEILDALPEAAYLINVSNDSWFGDSAAPHQHLQLARLRAIETERAMVRATSTGISAIINHKGDLVERSQQFAEQVLTGVVKPRHGRTPYTIWGNIPILGLSLLLTLGVVVLARKKKI